MWELSSLIQITTGIIKTLQKNKDMGSYTKIRETVAATNYSTTVFKALFLALSLRK